MFLIEDNTPMDVVMAGAASTGLVPRDPVTQGPGMVGLRAAPSTMQLIPRSEWSARCKEQKERQSSLKHIRRRGNKGQPIPSYDQNGQGYCWAYGTMAAVTLMRAANNQPYVRLSGHSVGCKVKNFRDEGGWAALSLDFIKQNGIVPASLWPEKSMSRANDTPENWRAAQAFRVTEDWMDLQSPVYNRDMTVDQIATLLLSNVPVVADMMWWGHCTVWMAWEEIEPGSFGPVGWNSWTDAWGDKGEYTLRGAKATPDNAVAPGAVMAG